MVGSPQHFYCCRFIIVPFFSVSPVFIRYFPAFQWIILTFLRSVPIAHLLIVESKTSGECSDHLLLIFQSGLFHYRPVSILHLSQILQSVKQAPCHTRNGQKPRTILRDLPSKSLHIMISLFVWLRCRYRVYRNTSWSELRSQTLNSSTFFQPHRPLQMREGH